MENAGRQQKAPLKRSDGTVRIKPGPPGCCNTRMKTLSVIADILCKQKRRRRSRYVPEQEGAAKDRHVLKKKLYITRSNKENAALSVPFKKIPDLAPAFPKNNSEYFLYVIENAD